MKLSSLLSDHCVLQRETSIPIRGKTAPLTMLTATLAGHTVHAQAGDDGLFLLRFPPLPAGGPHTLEVVSDDGARRAAAEDVLIGDVWLASGQSNMEWTLCGCDDVEAIDAATPDDMRMITIPRRADLAPTATTGGQWTLAAPEAAEHFSAVGFHFGQRIQKEIGVPVGVINASWGGTFIETWLSREALLANPDRAAWVRRYELDAYRPERWEEQCVLPADPGNEGVAKGYASTEFDDSGWETMTMPDIWQNHGHAYSGVFWFRKTVQLPESARGKEATLLFGGIDKQDVCYVNGEEVGRTGEGFQQEFWNQPRKYAVPASLTECGELTIAVRVYSFVHGGGFSGKASAMKLQLADGSTLSTAGEWRAAAEHNLGLVQLDGTMGQGNANSPYMCFENMIRPLLPAAIKGVIWYQGESNAGPKGGQYARLMQGLIADWRWRFAAPDLPFIQAQLANFRAPSDFQKDADWPVIRDQQLKAAEATGTGLAVLIDAGEAEDIHPRDKRTVGRRMAQWALANVYGKPIIEGSPIMTRFVIEPAAVRVFFRNVGEGLKTTDGAPVRCVYIAGVDGEFHPAETELCGDGLRAWSEAVPEPRAVRYAWSDNPENANLVNSIDLPASPFATDM